MFSGDLGRYDDAVMPDPEPVTEADYIIIESTYGNRHHDRSDAVEALGRHHRAYDSPRRHRSDSRFFAVGRAQSLIYDLWLLRQRGRLRNVPVYLTVPWPPAQLRCCTAMPTTTSSLNTISRRHSQKSHTCATLKSPRRYRRIDI